MGNSPVRLIGERIQTARNVLISSHVRPDWDAVGSILGLGLAIMTAGKKVQMVLEDGISQKYHHLPGHELIIRKPHEPYDLSIVVDCSDLSRNGNVLGNDKPDINIDHHITNLNFGKINLVDPQAAATSVILAENLSNWQLPITKDIATALLTGILGDTIGFRTLNTTAKELHLSAYLVEQGAEIHSLYNQTLVQQSYEAVQYWGAGLQKLQRQDNIVWASLSLEDRSRSRYPGNDDADLINLLSAINHSEIAIIFIEQNNLSVKVSWRAKQGLNVAKVALFFGGGGHAPAAGAEIKGSLSEVQNIVLDKTREILKSELAGMNKKDKIKEMKISKTGAFVIKKEGVN